MCIDESNGTCLKETPSTVGKLGLDSRGAFGNSKELFNPPKGFDKSYVTSLEQYKQMYKQSIEDPDAFWTKMAEVRVAGFLIWLSLLQLHGACHIPCTTTTREMQNPMLFTRIRCLTTRELNECSVFYPYPMFNLLKHDAACPKKFCLSIYIIFACIPTPIPHIWYYQPALLHL